MKSFLQIIIIASLLIASLSPAIAQKVGTTSLQFLKVMPNARATGMGDAFVTLATGSDAVFWNPAGLSIATTQEISTNMTIWLFDTKQSALAYSYPMGDAGSLGLQLQYVDFGEIEETRVDHLGRVWTGDGGVYYNPGLTGRTFSPKSYLIGITYARNLTSKFSTGLTIKYASENLWNDPEVVVNVPGQLPGSFTQETYKTNARLFLFDFGMRYNTGYHTIQLAAAVQNFGPQVQFAKEYFPAPLIFRLGVSGDLIGPDALLSVNENNKITASFDLIQPNDYLQQMNLGFEYTFANIFSLRTGYKFNYDTDGLTFGAGVTHELMNIPITFDYSYGNMGQYLSSVHRISLGVKLQ